MIEILVDTSVWSESLRRKKTNIDSEDTFLRRIINNNDKIVTTGIIIQEILTGIKKEPLFNKIKAILSDFSFIEPKKDDYINAAKLKNILRSKGITAGSIDFLIASICISNNILLATYDKDFTYIAKHSKLKILNPSKYKDTP